ncbi:hypothetical protein Csa_023367, partial [Cucumis sativus]
PPPLPISVRFCDHRPQPHVSRLFRIAVVLPRLKSKGQFASRPYSHGLVFVRDVRPPAVATTVRRSPPRVPFRQTEPSTPSVSFCLRSTKRRRRATLHLSTAK